MMCRRFISAIAPLFILFSPTVFCSVLRLEAPLRSSGISIVDLGGFDFVSKTAVLGDGRTVILGQTLKPPLFSSQLTLARLNLDGSLDSSFGSAGVVIWSLSPNSSSFSQNLLVQPDGKLVVVASCFIAGESDIVLFRFLSDGTLDASFGKDGVVSTDVEIGSSDFAAGSLFDERGRILVAGTTGPIENHDVVILRYRSDGTLDTDFGEAGMVVANLGGDDTVVGVALQGYGKIVVGGSTVRSMNQNIFLARFLSDGRTDSSFGQDGVVVTASLGSPRTMAVQRDGKIIIGGSVLVDKDQDFFVMRYLENGALDTFFGNAGIITWDFLFGSADNLSDMFLGDEGELTVIGTANADLALVRFLLDGRPDETFGDAGAEIIDISGLSNTGKSIAVQPDGKMVVVGEVIRSSGINIFDITIMRLIPNGRLDSSFGNSGPRRLHEDL